MSRWTHLAGIVRIDHLLTKFSEKEVLKVFKKDVPRGSEGPALLHVHAWRRVPLEGHNWDAVDEVTESSVYWGDLIVVGDLRDVGNDLEEVKRIGEWFQGRCAALKEVPLTLVRQAVLQIEIESGDTLIHSWTGNDEDPWKLFTNDL